jgi:hypothetical protein
MPPAGLRGREGIMQPAGWGLASALFSSAPARRPAWDGRWLKGNRCRRTLAGAEAAEAGWAILVKEAVANGRLAAGGDKAGPSSQLARLATAHGLTPDAIALAAALAKPWAAVVLSGAVTREQLAENLTGADGHYQD